jgi:hypothetical protein
VATTAGIMADTDTVELTAKRGAFSQKPLFRAAFHFSGVQLQKLLFVQRRAGRGQLPFLKLASIAMQR